MITNLLRTDLRFNDIPNYLILHIGVDYSLLDLSCKDDVRCAVALLNETEQSMKYMIYKRTPEYLKEKLEKTQCTVEQECIIDTKYIEYIHNTHDEFMLQQLLEKKQQYDKIDNEIEKLEKKRLLVEHMNFNVQRLELLQKQIDLLKKEMIKTSEELDNNKNRLEQYYAKL